LDDWIYWHRIYSHNSGLQAIHRYRYFTHFSVHRCKRTRVLSICWSYPGNGFQHCSYTSLTHEVFSSQPNSFLAVILQLPIPMTRLNSIASPYSDRLASRNLTARAFFLHGPHGKQPLLRRCVTDLLRSNRRPIERVCLRGNVLPSNGYTRHRTSVGSRSYNKVINCSRSRRYRRLSSPVILPSAEQE
jgi:hypothetical protein